MIGTENEKTHIMWFKTTKLITSLGDDEGAQSKQT